MTATMVKFCALLVLVVISSVPIVEGRSLVALLEDEWGIHQYHRQFEKDETFNTMSLHEGTLLSKTALIDKASQLNNIVREAKRRWRRTRERQLYTDSLDLYPHRNSTSTIVTAGGAISADNDNGSDEKGYTNEDADDVTYTEERVVEICQLIQDSFVVPNRTSNDISDPVKCVCKGTLHRTLSINCDYSERVCTSSASADSTVSEMTTCGKPQLGVAMVKGNVFSATTCIRDYVRRQAATETTFADTCVFVNACDEAVNLESGRSLSSSSFCDCTASYGGSICSSCDVCAGGQSMSIDCSNVPGADAITSRVCRPIDMDLDLTSNGVPGFLPKLSGPDGLCTKLESELENKVTCDCNSISDSNGTYDIVCTTDEDKCDDEKVHCGRVSSKIHVIDGQVVTTTHAHSGTSTSFSQLTPAIESCVTYPAPYGETCTTLDYCSSTTIDSNSANSNNVTIISTPTVCGCKAFYNGKECSSCNTCDDGQGIQLDCSNVYESAKSSQCQPISRASSFEFLPKYPPVQVDTKDSSPAQSSSRRTTNTLCIEVSQNMHSFISTMFAATMLVSVIGALVSLQ